MEASTLQILENLVGELEPWWPTIQTVCFLIGFIFIGSGLVSMNSGQRQGSHGGKTAAIITFTVGICLLNLPGLLGALTFSIFGSNPGINADMESFLSYGESSSESVSTMMKFSVTLFALVGLVAVARGLIMIKNTQHNPMLWGKAFSHIVGGVICINSMTFLKVIASSMGGEVESTITNLIGA